MNTFNWTDRVRTVLRIAHDEAARRHHSYVGTEHILLAMMTEGEGVGAAALTNLDLDFAAVRADIDSRVRGGDGSDDADDRSYDEAAKRLFELATTAAKDLKHSFVGTEHLLLGMLAEKASIGAQVLSDAGVTMDVARREVRLLSGEGFDELV